MIPILGGYSELRIHRDNLKTIKEYNIMSKNCVSLLLCGVQGWAISGICKNLQTFFYLSEIFSWNLLGTRMKAYTKHFSLNGIRTLEVIL